MDAIFKRRSIRKYTKEVVPDEMIRELIMAGMAAPSAGNEQPWHFIVINERSLLDGIQQIHPYSHMLAYAQVAILLCGDLTLEKHRDYWVQDLAAATENILIAVSGKGLGAVWLGIYPRKERVDGIRKLCGIPEHVIPFSLVPVGYPAEEIKPKSGFDMSRIRYNRWD
jgi:nitroreductase